MSPTALKQSPLPRPPELQELHTCTNTQYNSSACVSMCTCIVGIQKIVNKLATDKWKRVIWEVSLYFRTLKDKPLFYMFLFVGFLRQEFLCAA